jgi:acyl-CoA thioesterase-1
VLFFNTNFLPRKIYFLLFFIPLLTISDHLHAKQVKLLILGDSLSAAYGLKQEQGWVSLLQDAWHDKPISIVNAAISGETTDAALARLPRLLASHKPTHMYVFIGGNDGLQGHPVSKMKTNLINIIQLAHNANVRVILQEMQIPANYGKRYNRMFTDTYSQVASELNVTMLPFLFKNIGLNSDMMQQDGIHPNAKAQPIIAEQLKTSLGPLILP